MSAIHLATRRPALLIALGLLVLLRLPWLFTLIERDEGVFGYVGFVLASGGAPYVDVVDHHGLTLYAIFGLSHTLFGPSILPLRLLVLLLQIGVLLALVDLARRWFGRTAAAWAGMAFALFSNLPVFEAHAALTQSLAMPLAMFGVWAYERWRAHPHRLTLFMLAWFLLGLASSIRFTVALAGVALALVVCVDALREAKSWRAAFIMLLRRAALATGMVALVWSVVLLALLSLDALPAFFQILQETFVYVAFTSYSPPEMRDLMLLEGAPMFALLVGGLLVMLLQPGRSGRGHYMLLLFCVVFTWVVTRPPMLGHYFIQLIPFAALAAGVFCQWALTHSPLSPLPVRLPYWLSVRAVRQVRRGVLLVVLLGTALLSIPRVVGHLPDFHAPIPGGRQVFNYADQTSYGAQVATGAYLRALMPTVGGDLYVYGNSPLTYWFAEQRAPVRDTYAHNNFGWVVHEHGDPPPFVLVRRPTTQVVVLSLLYQVGALDDVEYYVTQHFAHLTTIGGMAIYQRRG